MKVAIDISQIIYTGTGVSNYTYHLVKNLLKIDKKNEYILFGMSWRQKKVLDRFFGEFSGLSKKVETKLLPFPQTLGRVVWNKYHRINIENIIGETDVFHSSDWIQPPARAKKVTTVHDLVVYRYPESSHETIIKTQKRRLYWVKKECDFIFADSYATKSDLIDILKIDSSRIEVVYPGINEVYKLKKQDEINRVKKKYNLPSEYILTISKREPRKNLNRVLAAFRKFLTHPLIKSKGRSPELIVVGKEGWGKSIKPIKNVRILGYIEDNELPSLYSGAHLFVYPSLYEGFGLPVLEAMSSGCPVITSNRGSLKEVAGDSALIVDPENINDIAVKMSKIFIDSELRKNLVKQGRDNAKQFLWRDSAKKVLALYNKIVKN